MVRYLSLLNGRPAIWDQNDRQYYFVNYGTVKFEQLDPSRKVQRRRQAIDSGYTPPGGGYTYTYIRVKV